MELEVTFCPDIEFCPQVSGTHSKCLCLTNIFTLSSQVQDGFPSTSTSFRCVLSEGAADNPDQFPVTFLVCKVRSPFRLVFCFSWQVRLRIFQRVESSIGGCMTLKARVNKCLEKMVLKSYYPILGEQKREPSILHPCDSPISNDFASQKTLGNIWRVFFYYYTWGEARDAGKYCRTHKTPPRPTTTRPDMSIVPQLRNPAYAL